MYEIRDLKEKYLFLVVSLIAWLKGDQLNNISKITRKT